METMDESSLMKNYEEMKKGYKTSPYLTKYEKTRVLGERANQIINGAPPFISDEIEL